MVKTIVMWFLFVAPSATDYDLTNNYAIMADLDNGNTCEYLVHLLQKDANEKGLAAHYWCEQEQ